MKYKKEQKKQPIVSKKQPVKSSTSKFYIPALIAIAIITILIYLPSFKGLFVWDDDFYVRDNTLIHSFDLKNIFSNYVVGNYHPFTILMLAIEYHFFELNVKGYHVINLLIHVLNTILVFYAIYRLSGNNIIALVTALLFGIHPLHVESTAWISEIKDLLYTFFFLLSYIYYLKFMDDKNRKFYFYSILFFLLSLLSKAMAASLPALLLLTDYFKGYVINRKNLVEKVPYFILAVVLGIVAVFAQKTSGATDIAVFPFPQRVIFASYGFIMYLIKLIVPVDLCAYYPYPIKTGSNIPASYFAFLLMAVAIVAYLFYSRKKTKKLFFGIGFFAITVFLVLQLLPVGGAIMADRYAYIPSIGIFYLAGEGFYWLWTNKNVKTVAVICLAFFFIFFTKQTYSRCSVWENGMTLWNDVIEKYQTVPQAYINRGILLAGQKKNDEALNDYNKAISLEPNISKAYNSRGALMRSLNKYEEAIKDFNQAIKLQPDYEIAYNNRGLVLNILQRYDEAIKDLSKAIEIKPEYFGAFTMRGIVYKNMKRYKDALNDFNKSIELDPKYTKAYYERAELYVIQQKADLAEKDYLRAIELQPDYLNAYVKLGNLNLSQKKPAEAIQNFTRAIELQPSMAEAYYYRGVANIDAGNKEKGCMDLQQAGSLGLPSATDEYHKFCR